MTLAYVNVQLSTLDKSRIAGYQKYTVPGNQLVSAVHLALVRENDSPPATERVESQSFLNTNLNSIFSGTKPILNALTSYCICQNIFHELHCHQLAFSSLWSELCVIWLVSVEHTSSNFFLRLFLSNFADFLKSKLMLFHSLIKDLTLAKTSCCFNNIEYEKDYVISNWL